MDTKTATPTPWVYHPDEDGRPISAGGQAVCYMEAYENENGVDPFDNEANAALIVKCVNNYTAIRDSQKELVEALKAGIQALESRMVDLSEWAECDQAYMVQTLDQLHAALAKAHSGQGEA